MAQNFDYDPFSGTPLEEDDQQQPNVTLNPPQPQQAVQQPAQAAPPPQPAPVTQPASPVDELPETTRLVITPERMEVPPASEFRTPDPFVDTEAENKRFDDFFRNPDPEMNMTQEEQIAKAKFYFTADGRKLGFPDVDLTNIQKKKLMFKNDGVAVNVTADDGTVPEQNGKFARFDLFPSKQYRDYTLPQAEVGALAQAGRGIQRQLLGPVGIKGDLARMDAGLQALGLNQNARTFYLRGYATNEFDYEQIAQGPQDIARFVLSMPAYAQKGVNFLHKDVVVPFVGGFLFGNDTTDYRRSIEKMNSDQFLNYEIPSYAQSIAEKYDVLPELVEYMIRPRGGINRAGKILTEELPMYSGAFVLRLGGAMKAFPKLDQYIQQTYQADNFVDGLKNADKAGISFPQIMENYLGTISDNYARERTAKALDLAMSLRVAKPGSEERMLMFRDNIRNVEDQITKALEDVEIAKRANNPQAVARANERIKNLQAQKHTLEADNLLPKYIADSARELRGTTVSVTAATTVLHDFFGMDEEYQPLTEFGAVISMVVLPGLRKNEGAPTVGDFMVNGTKTILAQFVTAFDAVRGKGEGATMIERFNNMRQQKALSREARNALGEIMQLPTELQKSFFAGVEEASVMRRNLIKLAEETGVDIDSDAFIENLAVLSNIGSLVTLSRNIQDKVTVTDLNKLQGQLMHHEQVLQAQEKLITSMAQATNKLLDATIVGSQDADVTKAASDLAGMMQSYIARSAEQLAADRQGLNILINTAGESLEQIVMSGTARPTDSAPAVNSALELMDMSARAGYAGVSQRAIDGVDIDPAQAMQDAARHIDALRAQSSKLVSDLTGSLSAEDAANGAASTIYTVAVGSRKLDLRTQVDEKYANFDTKHPNVRTNVAGDMMDRILDDRFIQELNDYAEEEIAGGALKLAGKKMPKGMQAGFLSLFNDGAREGIERIIRTDEFGIGAQDYDKIMETMGMGGASPIKQVLALRTVFNKTDEASEATQELLLDLFDGDLEMAKDFGSSIPILMSTASWRTVNKVLHKAAGREQAKQDGGNYRGLKNLIDRWESAGQETLADGTENPMAFRTGWGTAEEPAIVAPAVYEEFRGIQTFFREEYANRFYYGKEVRRIHNILTKPKQNAARAALSQEGTLLEDIDEWDITTFTREFRDVEFSPHETLDTLYGGLLNSQVTFKGERLLSDLEEPLAKSIGVYDPQTKRHYIIVESDLPEDEDVVTLGKSTSKLFTRWLQGKLASTEAGRHAMRKDGKGRDIFENLDADFEYNEAGFNNFANVQTYKRNSDGTLTPVGTLVDPEDAFSATTIDALEANRHDLREKFEQARTVLNGQWKRDATDSLAQYAEQIKAENDFISNFSRRLGVGGEGDIANVDVVAENIFNAVTRSDGIVTRAGEEGMTISQVKQLLTNQAIDSKVPQDQIEQFVDETIQRLVVRHINNRVSAPKGSTYKTILEDGTVVEVPTMGMDGRKLMEELGVGNDEVAGRLRNILGDKYDSLLSVGKVLMRMQQDRVPGVDGKLPGLSLDSILSRIYNINRQVVSTQWVATEMLIRASRHHGGKLLQAMLTDPAVAKEILDIVETGKVPKYKTQPDWLRALTFEIVRQEAVNDDAVSRNLGSMYTSVTDLAETKGKWIRDPMGALPPRFEPESQAPKPQLTPLQQQMRRLGRNPLN